MKLLIDEMFPAAIAQRVREEHGHDIIAIAERDDLVGLADTDVFLIAQAEERAIVTENVRDFLPIARQWQAMGRIHFGLVLTTNRKFPRSQPRTRGRLVTALENLLDAESGPHVASNREIWL